MRRPVVLVVVLACLFGLLGAYLGATSDSDAEAGARLAYVSGADHLVWLADANGKHARPLGSGDGPVVSPDGETVAASLPAPAGTGLVLYSVGGGAPRDFFSAGKVDAVPQAWSPDSRYLAVALSSASPGSTADAGLAIVDRDTGGVRVIARGQVSGASFAPSGPDRLVYALAGSAAISARFNLFVSAVDGSGRVQITRGGRSLNPIWGPNAIAFDRERLRRHGAPAYQIWLIAPDGTAVRRLTQMRVPLLQNGPVPIGFSADGSRLLARYDGLNRSQAWTIAIGSPWVRELKVDGQSVTPGGLSRDGATVLVDRGAFLNPPAAGTVESVPFFGGRATVVMSHSAAPNWNK
jgi:hypothetical protein